MSNIVPLAHDLNIITAEINSYKQIAGQSFFEIGRRLKHVKENDLAHGEFGGWLESIEFNTSQASRFIKIYEELGNSNLLTSANIGFRNLLEIASLPPEERNQTHTIPSTGESKKVDEMTVRELQEVKKTLQSVEQQALEAAERAAKAEQELYHWQGVAKSAQNRPPRIETKTVEVVPENIKKELSEKEIQIRTLRTGYQEAKAELEQYKLRDTSDFDNDQARKEREKLQHEADLNTLQVRVAFKTFVEKASITPFLHGAIASASESEKKRLQELAEAARTIVDQTFTALRGRREINNHE